MWLCEIYSGWLTQDTCNQSVYTEENLPSVIEQARLDWLHAHSYFNAVTEPELIDCAIYLIKAAEIKYTYLLKKAKRKGVKYSRFSQCQN